MTIALLKIIYHTGCEGTLREKNPLATDDKKSGRGEFEKGSIIKGTMECHSGNENFKQVENIF